MKIAVDKYHFIRQIIWALEKVRKRPQQFISVTLRKYYKRSRRLILARCKNLTGEAKQACDLMLHSDDLWLAHRMKEWFYDITQIPSYQK